MTVGIILAAGASSRMGQPKALLCFEDGSTLLEQQAGLLIEAGCSRVGVVIGSNAPEIQESHPALPVRWIINERWEMGQFTSLQAGVSSDIAAQSAAAIVLPIDCVGVKSEIISALIATAAMNPHLSAIIPEYQGRGGHPVCLFRAFCAYLAGLDPAGEQSRLDVLLATRKDVIRIPVNDPHIMQNINSEEEWINFQSSFKR